MFNEGYAASSEGRVRVDLCEEAIRLARLLIALAPGQAEAEGLLALMLFHHARARTRTGLLGEIVTLEAQDRSLWDRIAIDEAAALLLTALRRGSPGLYQFQAAIAAEHAQAPSFAATDWTEIAIIYEAIIAMHPNPVFEVNRVVALHYAVGPAAALTQLDRVAGPLSAYQPYHAVRAHILAAIGDGAAARGAYERAIALSGTDEERTFLAARRDALA